MITDLANLGPPLRATPDLGARPAAQDAQAMGNAPNSGSVDSLSFGKTLQKRMDAPERAKQVKGDQPERAAPDQKIDKPLKRAGTKSSERSDELETVKDDSGSTEEVSAEKMVARTPREKVMLKFMDSMESEFGIPPARIAEAMTKISDSELLKAPEETASQVLAQLDLEPEDQEKAMALYLGMVGALAVLPKAPDLFQFRPADLPTQTLNPPVILSSKDRRAMLNQSLDKMNSQFFMKDVMKTPAMPMESVPLESPQVASEPMFNSFELDQSWQAIDPKASPSIPQDLYRPPVNPAISSYGDMQDADTTEIESLGKPEQTELAKKLAAVGLAAGALSDSLKKDPVNAKALQLEQVVSHNPLDAKQLETNPQFDQSMNDFMSGKNSGGKNLKDSEILDSKDLKTGTAGFEGLLGANKSVPISSKEMTQPASFFATGAVGAGMMPTESVDKNSNVYQIMNQANYMIKKGGGEATIQMTPEGLGRVDLKVIVKDGKVDVQMATETKEAKKLIESSFADLRSSLSTHKLGVESLRVDVGNQTSSDNKNSADSQQQQNNNRHMNPNGENPRDQARQFLGQFRDENFEQRSSFGETTGLKAYGRSSRKVEPLQAAPVAGVSQKKYAGPKKGSGLDLVA